ncbi:MAG: hypothetical protein KF789_14105, partial [Bdellovibrionaceae bacterium]|nr:hypothetical protein [Pseudobdellovibrionaceae bacterium]
HLHSQVRANPKLASRLASPIPILKPGTPAHLTGLTMMFLEGSRSFLGVAGQSSLFCCCSEFQWVR